MSRGISLACLMCLEQLFLYGKVDGVEVGKDPTITCLPIRVFHERPPCLGIHLLGM